MPTIQQIEALHHKYAPNDTVYTLVYGHCRIVNEIALWAADTISDAVNRELLTAAALLHDIGTYVFYDENAKLNNHRLYPLHALLSAAIIRNEGLGEDIAHIVETHVLLGLSKDEIIHLGWPMPARDFIPDSLEGELLCYGDRFHSKKPIFNAYDTFLARLKADMPLQAAKFEAWGRRFGIPDVPTLAKKYGHPVR